MAGAGAVSRREGTTVGTGKHAGRRLGRGTIALLVVLAVLAAASAGSAFAAYRYDKARVGRILPGVTIDGVAVGDMTRSQAIAAVTAAVQPDLSRSISVHAGSRSWTSTLAALGLSADVAGTVDQALGIGDSYSWVSRAYHRLANKPIVRALTVPFHFDPAPVQRFVAQAAKSVGVQPRDASVSLIHGKVVMTHSRAGRTLRSDLAAQMLGTAVTDRQATLRLPLKAVAPKVGDADVGKTIVVNASTNRLFLYDAFKVIRTYPVATAAFGYVTPDGAWEVVNKVENPTWYNPAPTTWGKGEPLIIPPGPGNPLGTRALYLSAPGIRIHGTPTDSSIGHWASHGCIRMHISDSEALYPLVPIGTRVFIIGAPPWGVVTYPGATG